MGKSKELFTDEREQELNENNRAAEDEAYSEMFLDLLPKTKLQSDSIAAQICNEIEGGVLNPLETQVRLKMLISSLNEAITQTADAALGEAQKHGAKSFELMGCKIEIKELGSRWNFENTGDTEWQILESQARNAANSLKERQKFLQTITKPMEVVDRITGEIVTINPPVKSSVTGIAVTPLKA